MLEVFLGGIGALEAQPGSNFGPGWRHAGVGYIAFNQFQNLCLARCQWSHGDSCFSYSTC